ncbi:LuxR C-terminal-related transcriptional regulator [Rhizobium oryzicola]|uniref:LuxR C-terminal-related transcriptional regulator n=1 Tax=Rhizobium oryzicola TaxID=1232668 RepID=A0ABT8SVG4_9HYPH|nr:LuxR C-terminal-related transcriptional regulator [Rhizobium oryzicola]MDO1582418.1 LuxR C-terminal-related transcriptional regulator [Rhizobium oryzicola]
MTDEVQQFDLFGNPYEPGSRKHGRPSHEPTEATIVNVMVLLAAGQTNKEIGKVLGLDVKTLKRHYGHLLGQRDVMLNRLRTKLRTAQIQIGLAGNAAALSAAIKSLDGVDAERIERELRNRAANAPSGKGYISKKETRREAARNVGGKFAPPPPPRLVATNGQAIAAAEEE